MTDRPPMNWFLLAVFKFLGGAIMGALMALAVFFLFAFDIWDLSPKFLHIFWIFPLVWGVLAVFFFDKTIDTASDFLKSVFDR